MYRGFEYGAMWGIYRGYIQDYIWGLDFQVTWEHTSLGLKVVTWE